MIKLKELLDILEPGCHYRIYQPNRDCLIFESHLTIHSEVDLNENLEYDWGSIRNEYYTNNHYCYGVYHNEPCDIQTERFIKKYGDYEVLYLEVGSIHPYNIVQDEKGRVEIEYVEDKYQPNADQVPCVNIFII